MQARTAALIASLMLSACALGDEPTPGCRSDHPDDCDQGWSCREGMCVRNTTPSSPAPDSNTNGQSDDAAGDLDSTISTDSGDEMDE